MLDSRVNDASKRQGYYLTMETMGDRIKVLRQAKGLTQGELGDLVDVTKQAVSQWESGQTANIKLQTFLKLSDVLSARPEYLIWGPDRDAAGKYRIYLPRDKI